MLKKLTSPLLWIVTALGANAFFLWRWCRLDTRPFAWDESIHIRSALEFKSLLDPTYFYYPPLTYALLSKIIQATHNVADAGAILNFLVIAGTMFLIYGLGRHFMSDLQSAASAVIFSAYPVVVDLSSQPMIDLLLTFCVTLSIYFLLKSDHFDSLFSSVWFGVAVGLSLLAKWTAVFYLAGPVVWSLWINFRNKKSFTYFLAAVGAALLVAGPWYGSNTLAMLGHLKTVAGGIPASGIVLSGWKNIFWYPLALGESLNFYFFLLLLPGLAAVVWRPKLWPVLIWLVVSLAIFSCIHNRNVRYMIPALPAAALLSTAWLPDQRKGPTVTVLLGAFCFMLGYQLLPAADITGSGGGVSFVIFRNHPPISEEWHHQEIIARIAELKTKDEPNARCVVLSNAAFFHSTSLDVSRRLLHVEGISFQGMSKGRWMDFAQFILLKTGEWGPDYSIGPIKEAAEWMMKPPDWFKKSYREAGRWSLPDHTEAVLYEVHPEPMGRLDTGMLRLDIGEFKLPNIVLKNLMLRTEALSVKETTLGRLKELSLQCDKLIYKGMEFEHVAIQFKKPWINLHRFFSTGEIQLFSAESLRPHLTVSSDVFLEYALRKARWLKEPGLTFEDERIRVQGRAKGIPLELLLWLHPESSNLITRLEKVRLGPIAIPTMLFRGLTDRNVSLAPGSEFPLFIELGKISGKGRQLEVGGS